MIGSGPGFTAAFGAEFLGSVVLVDHDDFGSAALQVAHVVIGETAVEWEAFGELSLDILKLFAANAKGIKMAGDLIGGARALEDDATGLVGMSGAALGDDRSGLRRGRRRREDY
ncbi:MAG TPA: hypothetical protein VF753_19200 [Terriglobales bacterium]